MQHLAQVSRIRSFGTLKMATRLWLLMATDIAAFLWTATLGSWFDQTSRLTSIVTLGGHHVLVMILSGVASALLGVLVLVSNGFRDNSPAATSLVALSCIVSMVALVGFVSLVVAIVLAGLFLGAMVRLFS